MKSDRRLGIRYSNSSRVPPTTRRTFTLKHALKWMLIGISLAAVGSLLWETSHCVEGVRCTDN